MEFPYYPWRYRDIEMEMDTEIYVQVKYQVSNLIEYVMMLYIYICVCV